MRARRRQHRGDQGVRVNVTPMIDVVMVLIVFFLMVGHLAAERRARLDLPEAAGITDEDRGPVEVVIDPDRGVLVENEALAVGAVRAALDERGARDRGVRLAADRSLSYARIAPVLAACRDAGAGRVELSVTRLPSPGGGAP